MGLGRIIVKSSLERMVSELKFEIRVLLGWCAKHILGIQ